jgi:hypothetical protein
LEIKTPLVVSSTLDADPNLKSTQKVISICKCLNANTYINPIGGVELYSTKDFGNEGIDLRFLKTDPIVYPQFNYNFIQNLSIIDVLA